MTPNLCTSPLPQKKNTCQPIQINNTQIPQAKSVKYLGMHLDRRMTWKKHITTKRQQLNIKLREMYWLIGRTSRLSIANKLLLYKLIIKPIWTYGIQLWGTAANSNIEIIQRFQSKVLRCITNAPWYVSNEIINNDLQMTTVSEEIRLHSSRYQDRLRTHPNSLALDLQTPPSKIGRLKRWRPRELATRT